MRRLFFSISAAIIMITGMVMIQSCDKDDNPAPNVLVVAERNTGKIFKINKLTGAMTEIGLIKLPSGDGLTNIRGMIYKSSNRTLYVSRSDEGGGSFYTVNLTTKEATVLNENPDEHWYGVADLLLSSDKIIASLWFEDTSEIGYGPGLLTLNADGSVSDQKLFSINVCCGMGMTLGDSENEILIASDELEIYKSDLDGVVELVATLVPEGFEEGNSADYYIQNIVKGSDKLYATVYNDGNTYLAEINLADEKLIHIGKLNAEGTTTRYHGLVLIPGDKL